MTYNVYAVIYRSPDGLSAVAVSSQSRWTAGARVHNERTATIIDVFQIDGRKPEWKQDRIEGTCDLRNLQAKPPVAGSEVADEIREANVSAIMMNYKVPA